MLRRIIDFGAFEVDIFRFNSVWSSLGASNILDVSTFKQKLFILLVNSSAEEDMLEGNALGELLQDSNLLLGSNLGVHHSSWCLLPFSGATLTQELGSFLLFCVLSHTQIVSF